MTNLSPFVFDAKTSRERKKLCGAIERYEREGRDVEEERRCSYGKPVMSAGMKNFLLC